MSFVFMSMIFRDSYKNKCTEKLKTGIGLNGKFICQYRQTVPQKPLFPNLFTLISTSFHQEKE